MPHENENLIDKIGKPRLSKDHQRPFPIISCSLEAALLEANIRHGTLLTLAQYT